MFTSADTSSEAKPQLDLTGGIYFIKKKDGSNVWESEKDQEIPSSGSTKQVSKDDFESKFPSVGDAITDKEKFEANKDHWGFASGKDDFEKICSESSSDKKCKESVKQEDRFMGKWEWSDKASSQKKITDWSKN